MSEQDSFEQLKADLEREQPEAVDAAIKAKVDEFLEASMRFAMTMLRTGDPWQGIRVLTDALAWLQESQGRLEKEVAAARKPKATSEAFKK